jgi:hypothetical protein
MDGPGIGVRLQEQAKDFYFSTPFRPALMLICAMGTGSCYPVRNVASETIPQLQHKISWPSSYVINYLPLLPNIYVVTEIVYIIDL